MSGRLKAARRTGRNGQHDKLINVAGKGPRPGHGGRWAVGPLPGTLSDGAPSVRESGN
jgi:hypothetical protein